MPIRHFLAQLQARSRPLYGLTLACLSGALVSILFLVCTQPPVLGVNAWYKPFKFFVSTAIFSGSMGWYVGYLADTARVRAYGWGMTVLFGFEDGYILLQAARGQLSHFNVSSPVYTALYGLMALGAIAIALWTLYLGLSFFGHRFPQLPASYLWGIRLGLIIFGIYALEGLVMGGLLRHTVGGVDGGQGYPVTNWNRTHGDLRIAHFLGLHALQVLPLLGYHLVPGKKAIIVIGLLYALVTTAVFVQALAGRPLLSF